MHPKRITPSTCPHCGREFFPLAHQLKHGKIPYCSRPCFGANFPTTPAVDRFWAKVAHMPDQVSCWLWRGATDEKGYGFFRVRSQSTMVRTNRFAWELVGGAIPDGMQACHTCPSGDDPSCVRNDEPGIYIINGIARPRFGHLWLGTNADNMADMVAKGRSTKGRPRGW